MHFTRITETVAAFKAPPLERTIYDEINDHAKLLEDSTAGKVADKAISAGVYIGIVLPTSIILLEFLHKLTNITGVSIGVVGVGIGMIFSAFASKVHDYLVSKIPFYKLNPFFGGKIEETILAFKGRK